MKNIKSPDRNQKLKTDNILDTLYVYSNDEDIKKKLVDRKQINAHMARWFFDFGYNQLIWSDGLYEILELNSGDIDANEVHLFKLIHPDDKQIKIRAINLIRQEPKPVELVYRLVFPDGRLKWINEICSTEFNEEGNPIRSFGTIQDITKYKETEEKFKQKEKRFKRLIENLPSGIIISDNSKCIFLNSSAKKILYGKESTQTTKKNFLSFVHPENKDEFIFRLRQLFELNNSTPFQLKMLREDHSEFTAQVTLMQTIFQNRPSLQIIFDDLSQKRPPIQIKRENEIEVKNKSFALIAHDVYNPISNILGIIKLMQDSFDEISDDEKKKYLALLNTSTTRTIHLLNDLVYWAKNQITGFNFNPVFLKPSTVLKEIEENLLPALTLKSITINYMFDTNIELFADPNMLKTILQNLLHNAIKYSYPNSSIDVSLETIGNIHEFKVIDKGTGMSKEKIDNLFRIDKKRSVPGTNGEEGNGLGLILCKELLDNYGGKIWAESEPNHGSKFFFTMPDQINH